MVIKFVDSHGEYDYMMTYDATYIKTFGYGFCPQSSVRILRVYRFSPLTRRKRQNYNWFFFIGDFDHVEQQWFSVQS